jgi:hypothetical protein
LYKEVKLKGIIIGVLLITLTCSSCALFKPKELSLNSTDLANYPNLVEMSPNQFLEIIGMKSYTADQIKEMIIDSQPESIIQKRTYTTCSSLLTNKLEFEYASSFMVSSNFGIVTTIESFEGYNIHKYQLPFDSLETNTDWNISEKDLHNVDNRSALRFIFQFLRTDGNELSLKYKSIFKAIASESEKVFYSGLIDHVNGLNIEQELPLARKVLQSDKNIANRWWALMILMRSEPSESDIDLLFKEMLVDESDLNLAALYVARETLKLKEEIDWSNHTNDVISLLNGGAIMFYNDFLKVLVDNRFNKILAEKVISNDSPILQDSLNSFDEKRRSNALAFIKYLSNNRVNDIMEANKWLSEITS